MATEETRSIQLVIVDEDAMNSISSIGSDMIMTTISSPMNACVIAGELSEPSSPESSPYDDTNILDPSSNDMLTTQLAAAGPVGVAAAAAIATGKKRRRIHSFETNPSIRRRQRTRLLRKLKALVEEYTVRVGQQAVVMCCIPGKSSQISQAFKVFGSQPLENVVRNSKGIIMQDLETALAEYTPTPQPEDPTLHKLPPLVIDGIPTPVDKMTQAQLRAFIPEMLKYSTGRSKPGWGKPECRPVWWPEDVPWANVRSDVRSDEEKKSTLHGDGPKADKTEADRPLWWPSDTPWTNDCGEIKTEIDNKKKISWTHALRQIVKNCYKHHGREDLLPVFSDCNLDGQSSTQYAGTMVQTINNPDGTVSIIQIDTAAPGSAVVTLSDGTQATVIQTVTDNPQQEATQAVQTLAEVAVTQHNQDSSVAGINTETTTLADASLNQHTAQIVLASDGSALGGKCLVDYADKGWYVQSLGEWPTEALQKIMVVKSQQKVEVVEKDNLRKIIKPDEKLVPFYTELKQKNSNKKSEVIAIPVSVYQASEGTVATVESSDGQHQNEVHVDMVVEERPKPEIASATSDAELVTVEHP